MFDAGRSPPEPVQATTDGDRLQNVYPPTSLCYTPRDRWVSDPYGTRVLLTTPAQRRYS